MDLVRKLIRFLLWIIGAIIIFAIVANLWIILSTADQVKQVKEITEKGGTALILGTSYNTTQGKSNPFFTSRIATAVTLFNDKLVQDFILSGSATAYYNEPKAMAKSLLESKVPANILTYDTLGVRTLSSIVRCKEVYHKERIVIVTQKFHAYRALFISNYYNLEAIAIPTDDINVDGKSGLIMREFFARPLAVIDLYILNRRP